MLELVKLMLEYIEINNATVAQHSHFVRKGWIEKRLKVIAKELDKEINIAKTW